MPISPPGSARSAGLRPARLGRWGGEIPSPGPVPRTVRAALRSPVVGRELAWVAAHATGGLLWSLLGVVLPLYAVRDTTYPLWRPLLASVTSGPPAPGAGPYPAPPRR